jgi:hypothetical protein
VEERQAGAGREGVGHAGGCEAGIESDTHSRLRDATMALSGVVAAAEPGAALM